MDQHPPPNAVINEDGKMEPFWTTHGELMADMMLNWQYSQL